VPTLTRLAMPMLAEFTCFNGEAAPYSLLLKEATFRSRSHISTSRLFRSCFAISVASASSFRTRSLAYNVPTVIEKIDLIMRQATYSRRFDPTNNIVALAGCRLRSCRAQPR
jgi:hypothetical protein